MMSILYENVGSGDVTLVTRTLVNMTLLGNAIFTKKVSHSATP